MENFRVWLKSHFMMESNLKLLRPTTLYMELQERLSPQGKILVHHQCLSKLTKTFIVIGN